MRRLLSFAIASAFVAGTVFAQSPATPPDGRTLQSLLEEVRSLRRDLQTTSATVQRMQILLYRIRNQMEVVNSAMQQREMAQAAVTQAKNQREYALREIQGQQEALEKAQETAARNAIQARIDYTKEWLRRMEEAEPEAQSREAEAASTLRNEQAKLNELQEQLDRLDRRLDGQLMARQ